MRYIFGASYQEGKPLWKPFKWLFMFVVVAFIAFALWSFIITVNVPSYSSSIANDSNNFIQTIWTSIYKLETITPYTENASANLSDYQYSNDITSQATAAIILMSIFFAFVLVFVAYVQIHYIKRFVWEVWLIALFAIIAYISIMVVAFVFPPSIDDFRELQKQPSVHYDHLSTFYKVAIFNVQSSKNSNLNTEVKYEIIAYAIVVLLSILGFAIVSAYNIAWYFRQKQKIRK